jgi:hypothetical protein
VFIVVIVAAIILAIAASSKGGGSSSSPGVGGGGSGLRATPRATPSTGGALRATPPGAPPVSGGGWRGAPAGGGWSGGSAPVRAAGAPVYYGGGPRVGLGVGVYVPLSGPVYTHDGNVGHDDEWFAGDELYVSMTLVSTYDGRVLWHAREHLDVDAEDNVDVDGMVQAFLSTLPARGAPPAQ